MADAAKPVGALHTTGAVVVNCAATKLPVPDAQVAITLQSYNELCVSPVRFAVVAVCAVAKLVHTVVEFNLYSTA